MVFVLSDSVSTCSASWTFIYSSPWELRLSSLLWTQMPQEHRLRVCIWVLLAIVRQGVKMAHNRLCKSISNKMSCFSVSHSLATRQNLNSLHQDVASPPCRGSGLTRPALEAIPGSWSQTCGNYSAEQDTLSNAQKQYQYISTTRGNRQSMHTNACTQAKTKSK